jgi:hypothetical protein
MYLSGCNRSNRIGEISNCMDVCALLPLYFIATDVQAIQQGTEYALFESDQKSPIVFQTLAYGDINSKRLASLLRCQKWTKNRDLKELFVPDF